VIFKAYGFLFIFIVSLTTSLNVFAIETHSFEIKELNISIKLPSTFKEMPEKLAELKYPSKNRPQVIYSDESGSVSFGISKKNKPDLVTLVEIKNAMLKGFSNFNPKSSKIIVDGYDAWLITFKSKAIDSDILNIQLITITDKDFVMATFNMASPDVEKYQVVGINSLSSIRFK
jgi:hypothetical protein